jgi:hypothetical protein
MNKGKNTAIEGQDLEENVFRAFVDIVMYLRLVKLLLQRLLVIKCGCLWASWKWRLKSVAL